MTLSDQRKVFQKMGPDACERLQHSWELWGRPAQHWDEDGPTTQAWMAGRGFGKTRCGAERTHQVADDPELCGGQILIAAPTAGDARDLQIEGPSGLEATQKPWNPILYEPSKKLVTWKNGVVGHIRSSEKPRSFRGLHVGFAWLEEIAFWSDVQECWHNLQLSLRAGRPSTCMMTTTPIPSIFIRSLLDRAAEGKIKIIGGSSYDNEENLDPTWFSNVIESYEGTDLGDQEIHGRVRLENPNKIWHQEWIRRLEPWDCEGLFDKTVVAVDPAGGTASKKSDEHGIVGVSSGFEGQLYVRADRSLGRGDNDWPEAAVDLALELDADEIVGEINFGGDMVERAIQSVDKFRNSGIKFVMVRAMASKAERAKLPARIYQKSRGFHVGPREMFRKLEEQMTGWDPTIKRIEGKEKKQFSPDRMDAMVHAQLHLMQLGSVGAGPFNEYSEEDFDSLVQVMGNY